jgi:putative transposase
MIMAKTQTLSFPIRLPDAMQDEALRLLDASRTAINGILEALWPDLDAFATERSGPAWKQVERRLLTRSGHGSRQERCEMEQAGRTLRAQATRKQVFLTLLPLLTEGLIRPADGKRPAKKDYRAISEQVRALRADLDDPDAFMALTNVLEQACNVYLQTGTFPATYEQMQRVPVQEVAQLTLAGDDGMTLGQTYRIRLLWEHFCDLASRHEQKHAGLWLKLRTPDASGTWAWGEWSQEIALPEPVFEYLAEAAVTQAPTLREITSADGSRVAVLDVILEVPAVSVSPLEQERRVLGWDWGVRSLITVSVLEMSEGDEPSRQVSRPVFLDSGGLDGRQARLRREIDRLKACKERYGLLVKHARQANQEQHIPLPGHFAGWQAKIAAFERRIQTCWKKYERRNRELAHLASNLLILLALLSDCRLICGENLSTLKSQGRGRGVRGRFRNWRNNTTVRGELWRVLRYKCQLLGIRARQVEPRGTTHTCPRCHQPAKTYASSAPADRNKAIDWGAWLCRSNPACGWNGARDYAASLNIAWLGLAFLTTYHQTKRYVSYRMTDGASSVKPALYSRAGATLLLPSQRFTPRPNAGKHIYYAGWSFSIALRTSRPKTMMAVLSTSRFRKHLLKRA